MRRLGFCLMQTGFGQDGLQLLGQAVARERSPENLVSLAEALAFPRPGVDGSQTDRERALVLAQEAVQRQQGHDDPSYLAFVGQLALSLHQQDAFSEATAALERSYPETMTTHYFAAIRDVLDGRWTDAEREVEIAERLGLPHEAAVRLLDAGVRSHVRAWRYGIIVAVALAAWAAGLVALLIAGRWLSSATLRSLAAVDPNEPTSHSELSLRRTYRRVIRVAGIYYYVSLPFVLVLVLGGTAAVVYAFMMAGRVPIKLVLVMVIGALVTAYKLVQSLFVRVESEDPGRSLEQTEAPGLWTLAREVADTVGTRAVDEIRITPGTEMAVYERGSEHERSTDQAQRILILGAGLLNGFRQSAFRAVLAHEYGHFSHRDTAGGDVALRVRQDMMKFAIAMAQHGQAVWWNLAFQFLRLYDFLYRRISHGATRLQEVLADRVAARVYGPAQFEEGLRHVIHRGIEFDAAADLEIRRAMHARRSLANLYTLPVTHDNDVEGRYREALERQTREDDTHPAPTDRFRLVSRVVSAYQPDGTGMVWDLFADQATLTAEMTGVIAERVKEAAGE
jgi:Zn-dependent protease with chaperone function